MATKFEEIEPEIDAILGTVQPKFSKAIPDVCTMGFEANVAASEENPAFVVVRCGVDDRQRAGQVHDRIVRLVREKLPAPCPPFRWIIHEYVPYTDRLELPMPIRTHHREGSTPYFHDYLYDEGPKAWSHAHPITMGASLGTLEDVSGAGSLGCFARMENDPKIYVLTCHHNLRGIAGNTVEAKRVHRQPLGGSEGIEVVVPANCDNLKTQSNLLDRVNAAQEKMSKCQYAIFPFEHSMKGDMPLSLQKERGNKTEAMRQTELTQLNNELNTVYSFQAPTSRLLGRLSCSSGITASEPVRFAALNTRLNKAQPCTMDWALIEITNPNRQVINMVSLLDTPEQRP